MRGTWRRAVGLLVNLVMVAATAEGCPAAEGVRKACGVWVSRININQGSNSSWMAVSAKPTCDVQPKEHHFRLWMQIERDRPNDWRDLGGAPSTSDIRPDTEGFLVTFDAPCQPGRVRAIWRVRGTDSLGHSFTHSETASTSIITGDDCWG